MVQAGHQALHVIAIVTLITEDNGRPVPPHAHLAGLVNPAHPASHLLRLCLRSLQRQTIVLHYRIDTYCRMTPLSIPHNAHQLMVCWQLPEFSNGGHPKNTVGKGLPKGISLRTEGRALQKRM
jgi:hypothetical protein